MHDDQAQPDPSADIEALAPRFEALGLGDIAARLRALAASEAPPQDDETADAEFPPVPARFAPEDLLNLAAATELLGLRSSASVLTLARMGTLEAYARGADVLLGRKSVERYADSPAARAQRLIEQQLLSILDQTGEL